MASVDTAILFIGADRTIQLFTPSAARLFNLIEGDPGRPITDITTRFEDPDLSRDIDLVLSNLSIQTVDVRGDTVVNFGLSRTSRVLFSTSLFPLRHDNNSLHCR